ncbi:hypothetical protein [Amycolatopsis sp. H20-H5]|uniref:hypothetical protein n=1 Tax=Amycolatopsis sp. H20-H5 TaxID=3046309 RepID=UPI002DBEB722|nr:hypothetical protein [Amycolatopsis sp. H20-H5]MEC3981660.1 hypothetical protein [Amycolatopsis sp. H20-H5]
MTDQAHNESCAGNSVGDRAAVTEQRRAVHVQLIRPGEGTAAVEVAVAANVPGAAGAVHCERLWITRAVTSLFVDCLVGVAGASALSSTIGWSACSTPAPR